MKLILKKECSSYKICIFITQFFICGIKEQEKYNNTDSVLPNSYSKIITFKSNNNHNRYYKFNFSTWIYDETSSSKDEILLVLDIKINNKPYKWIPFSLKKHHISNEAFNDISGCFELESTAKVSANLIVLNNSEKPVKIKNLNLIVFNN